MNDYTASPVDWNLWQGEILATLMFIIHDDKVLLIEKNGASVRAR